MTTLNCIAVDDEPLSLRIIEKYAEEVPHLKMVAYCHDAFEAMEVLRSNKVDLMFLDINMPKLSGISLVKSLDKTPLVVFTTAYPEYAVEGFELEALDYLLKPFSFERFLKAVNRVTEKLDAEIKQEEEAASSLLIKADKKLYKIDFHEILYLEAYGDYVKVFTKEKMLLTKEKLSVLEEALPKSLFQRIHRSYIISLAAVEYLEGNMVRIGASQLPFTTSCKDELIQNLKKM